MDGPCLNSQIDLCYAPCSGEISKEEYDEIINKIDLFFQGKYSVIVKNLKKEMAEAAENEQFEKAAVLRDQITSIEEIMEKQFVDLVDDDLDQEKVIALLSNFNTFNIQYDQLCHDLIAFIKIFQPDKEEIRIYKTEELIELLEAKVNEVSN